MSAIEVIDGTFAPELIAEAAASWPGADWPHWFAYDSRLERKRTCRNWRHIPEPCRRLLALLSALVLARHPGLVPDTSLYGAGMCDMREGDYLGLHLDHDRHPHLGLTRALNAVLFAVPRWEAGWGGGLELWDEGRTAPTVLALPQPGRVVLFAPDAPHAVRAVAGPGVRAALAVQFYGRPWLPAADAARPRACFVGAAGEGDDSELRRLREERCGRS